MSSRLHRYRHCLLHSWRNNYPTVMHSSTGRTHRPRPHNSPGRSQPRCWSTDKSNHPPGCRRRLHWCRVRPQQRTHRCRRHSSLRPKTRCTRRDKSPLGFHTAHRSCMRPGRGGRAPPPSPPVKREDVLAGGSGNVPEAKGVEMEHYWVDQSTMEQRRTYSHTAEWNNGFDQSSPYRQNGT